MHSLIIQVHVYIPTALGFNNFDTLMGIPLIKSTLVFQTREKNIFFPKSSSFKWPFNVYMSYYIYSLTCFVTWKLLEWVKNSGKNFNYSGLIAVLWIQQLQAQHIMNINRKNLPLDALIVLLTHIITKNNTEILTTVIREFAIFDANICNDTPR